MMKYFSQVLLLAGVCSVWGQSITEELPGQAVTKDSTAAITAKNITTPAIAVKDTVTSAIIAVDSTVAKTDSSKIDSVMSISDSAKISDTITGTPVVAVDSTQKTAAANDSAVVKIDTVVVAPPEKKDTIAVVVSEPEKKKIRGGKSGIGGNLMAKIFFSEDINNYLDDIYERWEADASSYGSLTGETGTSAMFLVSGVKLKGLIYAGPIIGIEPFGMLNFGMKMMRITNMDGHDVDATLLETGGGVNVWARVSPYKVTSFKAGLGGYCMYTNLNVDGYFGEVEHTGIGFGMNILAGIDITLKKITVNVDFSLPVGSTDLDQSGTFSEQTSTSNTVAIRYPKKYSHMGIEIRPGITIHF